MPVVTITNTDLIFITIDIDGVPTIIKKSWCRATASGNNLILNWFNELDSKRYNYEQTIDEADVTVPVHADITALLALVTGYLTNAATGIPQPLTDAHIFVGNGSNVASDVAMSGDATITNTGALTIANDAVSNAKLANVPTATFKGRTTAATGDPEDLTVTQATALLNNMVGDSGAGGTKGLVPAPAAGDAAASKFLKADGTWTAAGSSADASETVKGVVEEATQAETNAGTDTGATGAKLFVVPSKLVVWIQQAALTIDAIWHFVADKFRLFNAAKTFYIQLTTSATANRTQTFQDATGTIALTSDIKLFNYSRTTASGTATTSEEVLLSILIPANTLGNNDSIEVVCLWSGTGTTGSTKTMRVRLHTSAAAAGTIYSAITTTAASTFTFNGMARIYQKNATNIQEGSIGASASGTWGGNANAIVTSALSNASDIYINITTQKAAVADTMSINSVDVVIHKAT